MARLFRKLDDGTEETIFDGDKWLPIINETQLLGLFHDVVGEMHKRGLTKKVKKGK